MKNDQIYYNIDKIRDIKKIAIAKSCEKFVIFSFWAWKSLKNLNFEMNWFDENYRIIFIV